MRLALVVVCLAAALPTVVARAADAAVGLRFRADLAVPDRSADDLVGVRVDGIAGGGANAASAAMRIVDGEDRAVPFLLRTESVVVERTQRRAFAVRDVRFEPRDEGAAVISFTIDPRLHGAPIDGFRIVTPLVDFQQRVAVERQDGDGSWTSVVGEALICDYSRWMDVRNTDVAFPADARRFVGGTYRITIDEATAAQRSQATEVVRSLAGAVEIGTEERFRIVRQPFRIDRIEAWHDEVVSDRRPADPVPREVVSWGVVAADATGVTTIRVATGGGTVTMLRLTVADRNFSRAITVTTAADDADGRRAAAAPPIGSGRIERIDLRGLSREHLTVPVDGQATGPLVIRIADGDSPPLRVTGVEALGPASTALFLAAPGQRYRLAYGLPAGAAALPVPRYDTAAIEAALAAGRVPTMAVAAAAVEVPVAAAPPPPLVTQPWLLGTVIAVLAATLALALMQAARRIDRVADEAENGAGGRAVAEQPPTPRE